MSVNTCWICGSKNTELKYDGSTDQLNPNDFRITDRSYGTSLPVHHCKDCGFDFCPDATEVLKYYEQMDDPEYDASREVRIRQANHLLKALNLSDASEHKLLDVGAGTGIFIQAAKEMGYRAVGVEPSKAMSAIARERGLDVRTGVLADFDLKERFDVVLLIDVIEHVADPGALLAACRKVLEADGRLLVVTPDISSIAARVLGRRWWHIRVAHIGYFNKKTFSQLAAQEDLSIMQVFRPTWYFSAAYLLERLSSYVPLVYRLSKVSLFKNLTVPLNLRDSLAFVLARA